MNLIRPMKLNAKMRTLNHETKVAVPNCQDTAAINASEATVIPSKIPAKILDERSLLNNGCNKRISRKEGKKMPTVANKAPGTPWIR